ncbi:GNAT family N-acetyltransferase [Flavobacterium sp. MC2016-06]|uniref:GNAT family N-acetyltransferase n=1 Tax=Flavobacterium sp. MC2016-06 TaxID=2676308 RepID=UPI0012BAFC1F|nr:GNAT family N-acetyltransferase [Flavobacterium sp. MC2016-06]MBU3862324.1 GNAT family N-acetyltransferase [Flavobacterium sp. MC2016-06]
MVTIQKCELNDLDLLHQIAIQSYNDTYQYLWHDKGTWYLNQFYKKETFEKELSNSGVFYFLIYDDNKAVGYFKMIEDVIEPYPASECLELDKLYLLKEGIGKGIGKIVMDFVISFAKEKKRSILWLKVMECSPAKFLYEKSGFIQTDIYNLDYPEIVEEFAPITTMVLEL